MNGTSVNSIVRLAAKTGMVMLPGIGRAPTADTGVYRGLDRRAPMAAKTASSAHEEGPASGADFLIWGG